jgi:hypothetical protein
MDTKDGHKAWTCSIDKKHGHGEIVSWLYHMDTSQDFKSFEVVRIDFLLRSALLPCVVHHYIGEKVSFSAKGSTNDNLLIY